jgi:sugar lactone lactonase YvrE
MKAKHLLRSQNSLGEGPLWHPEEQTLYWVDILGKTINRFKPETGVQEHFAVDSAVGVIALRKGGGFVSAGAKGFGFWEPGQEQIETINDPEADQPGSRFNDGKVDQKGRFWAGTMTHTGAVSSLYRMDADLSIHTMETGLTISNGIGWRPEDQVMYLVDSLRYVIYAYDFDLESGEISNRRVFVQLSKAYGIPDGLTVDREGCVWCAIYGGSRVTRFSPKGKVLAEISLPVSQPTSCAFGGKDMNELFITSASEGLSEEARKLEPKAGDLFVIKTDVQGCPEPKFLG